ncbi:MAG: Rne/Rng family ribonuclease [Terracidiphilus sp.]|jgi:ribonuclease G
MAKEICISSTPHETRLAILEDDQLAEIYYERENEYTLAGSIYNGRVTRVLPGMQSAFVDVGLERDAFLYVTDFLELEDPEETDELEKAAATGGMQPPREVRHSSEPEQKNGPTARNGRQDDRGQRSSSRPGGGSEPRPDRQPRDQRLQVEAVPEAANAAPEPLKTSEQAGNDQEEDGQGSRRWRGRRRRRGGRGSSDAPESQPESAQGSEEPARNIPQPSAGFDVAPTIQAAASHAGSSRESASQSREGSSPQRWSGQPQAERFPIPHVPFVLPGESLRKYGGTPASDAPSSAPEPATPSTPASGFKPSTLIETPLAWDGSGLLPGESISRHRARVPEPILEVEPQSSAAAPDEIEEEEFVTERAETPESTFVPLLDNTSTEPFSEFKEDRPFEDQPIIPIESVEFIEYDEFEETASNAPEPPAAPEKPAPADADEYSVEPVIDQPSVDDTVAEPVVRQNEAADLGTDRPDDSDDGPDRSASHHVDPSAPTGFRLFGFGGKKKDETAPAKPASAAAVSSYAPGTGVIEEEVIDEEEFDAPRHSHHGKADEHDLEDFEEETLPVQARSGDLGELLQEAHLDHRIQLNFDSKNVDEEDTDDEDDEEEPAVAGQAPAGDAQSQQRRDRDRGGRGRRGGRPNDRAAQGNRRGPSRRSMQTSDLPIISDLLKPGQEILVQIAKEPIAKKGARITSHIALPGRFLVFMPTVTHIGVSRKIASDEERHRLKRILVHERGEASGGFIVRTAAEGASEEELRADLRMLLNLWAEIKQRSDASNSPALIYHDLGLIERILRDQVSANFASIWVDSEADYERIVRFLNRFSPNLVRRVKLYTKETPLFEHFGIQDEISKALRSKVWLKSGGSIVINQTEALVAIDINTGKYVGKSARLEDTIVKTNLDAVPEIVRQIRLRDLGGIIVIDFIDMDDRKNRFRVLAALEEALKSDRAPTKVLQFNDFGLVAITRKRVKQSLERTLSVPCPTCQATGMVKSPTTVCNEIYTELRKMKKHFEGADVLLRVNPETVKVLKANNESWLTEFEEMVGKNILVKSDATLHPEQFDIQG